MGLARFSRLPSLYMALLVAMLPVSLPGQVWADEAEFDLRDHSHALIIANSRYETGWRELPGVKSDGEALIPLFQGLGYSVTYRENLDSGDLRAALVSFVEVHGQDPDARLLIYYMGHGETLQNAQGGEPVGYVIPTDTPEPGDNRGAFLSKALPLFYFRTMAQQVDARQVLFIFDSCFAGTIFSATRGGRGGLRGDDPYLPSRMVLTAGGAEQEVPDYSLFRRALVDGLSSGAADSDRDGYILGSELGDYVRQQVVEVSRDRSTVPEWGHIMGVQSSGDFLVSSPLAVVGPVALPKGDEACNGEDDDGDGQIDEGFDRDLDGHLSLLECGPLLGDDCNDTQTRIHPGVPDLADFVDEDCDGYLDEDGPDLNQDGVPDHLAAEFLPDRRRAIGVGLGSALLVAGSAAAGYRALSTVEGAWGSELGQVSSRDKQAFGVALGASVGSGLLSVAGLSLTIRYGRHSRATRIELLPFGAAPNAATYQGNGATGMPNAE